MVANPKQSLQVDFVVFFAKQNLDIDLTKFACKLLKSALLILAMPCQRLLSSLCKVCLQT